MVNLAYWGFSTQVNLSSLDQSDYYARLYNYLSFLANNYSFFFFLLFQTTFFPLHMPLIKKNAERVKKSAVQILPWFHP